MKSMSILKCILIIVFGSQLILQQSCKKKEIQNEPLYLTVNLPRSVFQNESYYSLNYQERSIEIEFSQPIDSSTIKGNISFSDKDGPMDSIYKTVSSGRKVIIAPMENSEAHRSHKKS